MKLKKTVSRKYRFRFIIFSEFKFKTKNMVKKNIYLFGLLKKKLRVIETIYAFARFKFIHKYKYSFTHIFIKKYLSITIEKMRKLGLVVLDQ